MSTTGRGPGRPRDPVSRDALRAAAIRVFARDGFGAARLSDIAAEAGITKGALAYHFASKEELYFETMSSIVGGFSALVRHSLDDPGPWVARLDNLGIAVTEVFGAEPDIARLILRELTDRGPFLSGPGGPAVAAVLALVTSFLAERTAQDADLRADPRHLAGTIVLIHIGWFGAGGIANALGADPADPEALAARRREVIGQIRRLCGVP